MVHRSRSNRFDFGYWPPRPVEQPTDEPCRIDPDDVVTLNPSTVYIHDDTQRRQVRQLYQLGDYVDIEDFWLASNPPKPAMLGRAAITQEGDFKVTRHYLKRASELFREIVFALDGTNHYGFRNDIGENFEFLQRVFCGGRNEQHPKRPLDRHNILVAREALARCFDAGNPLVYIELPVRPGEIRRYTILGEDDNALVERVQAGHQTYEDRLFPDTIPKEWVQ